MYVPSGNLLHSYRKLPIYSGFTHWKWWFSIAMLNYQRVYHICTNTHGMIQNKTSMVQKCNIYHSRRYTQNFNTAYMNQDHPHHLREGGNPWKSLMNELDVFPMSMAIVLWISQPSIDFPVTSQAQQSCQPFFDEAESSAFDAVDVLHVSYGGFINGDSRYPNSWMVYHGKCQTKMDDLGVPVI